MGYNSKLSSIFTPFSSLKNRVFARLYFAQAVSLLGDAFSWVGLALISYQFGGDRSAIILSGALTLRVCAFIIFSPFAGVLADKMDRKKILYITHFIRMLLVSCLPFITEEWQIYLLVFFLNVFNAFFTPTYKSIIPQIIAKDEYRQSIGLSSATFELLGILGPGLAGMLAIWLGAREIFFADALSFLIAGILILMLPANVIKKAKSEPDEALHSNWYEVVKGAKLLFSKKLIRFALAIEFVSAICGAQILVNTVDLVKNGLKLPDTNYGWVMAAFGIGATLAAFISGNLDKSKSRKISLITGAVLLSGSIIVANHVGYFPLVGLWLIAGFGQSLAEIPSETLIGENIEKSEQGKVYGSHFAFSHLWWAIAYPIAGYLGTNYSNMNFFGGGIIGFGLLIAVLITSHSKK